MGEGSSRNRSRWMIPLMKLVAAEAVIGLLIEITFMATFTQRFFAR
jgi:hypothetical protein